MQIEYNESQLENIGYCYSATSYGAQVYPIQVEAKSKPGKPIFQIIGLGDNAVRESKDRITSALRASGFDVPDQILINLAPADLKKTGSALELAIAVALLTSDGQMPHVGNSKWVFGELSLDGSIKPVKGIVGFVSDAALNGVSTVFTPVGNYKEASLIDRVQIIPVANINDIKSYLLDGTIRSIEDQSEPLESAGKVFTGFSDVSGQEKAKYALEIAAAGGHNLLMVGPPGCGKSMLAERFNQYLPPLSTEEKLECIRITSLLGKPYESVMKGIPPYRSPHHVVSDVGLIGGGSEIRPGEISLAHNGVLFLDEFPEFKKSVLDALRAPLETGKVTITRAKGSATFPAKFQLIAAMNACPCGKLQVTKTNCRCGRQEIVRYLKKLSQPILERIDIQVNVSEIDFQDLSNQDVSTNYVNENERSARIFSARELQKQERKKLNCSLSFEEITQLGLQDKGRILLEAVAKDYNLSARSVVRLLRVARTVADLNQSDEIKRLHIANALQFRAVHDLWRYVESSS